MSLWRFFRQSFLRCFYLEWLVRQTDSAIQGKLWNIKCGMSFDVECTVNLRVLVFDWQRRLGDTPSLTETWSVPGEDSAAGVLQHRGWISTHWNWSLPKKKKDKQNSQSTRTKKQGKNSRWVKTHTQSQDHVATTSPTESYDLQKPLTHADGDRFIICEKDWLQSKA